MKEKIKNIILWCEEHEFGCMALGFVLIGAGMFFALFGVGLDYLVRLFM